MPTESTPKRCSKPRIGLALTAPLKTALSEMSSSDGISLILSFGHARSLIAHLKVNHRQKPQNKNTESPLIGKQRRRVAQAIRPKTERLDTMSAQRSLFCILLYSLIHFKKSIVRKVRISTISLSYYLCSHHFCFHDLLTTLFSPNFMHVRHAKCEKIRANSIRNQIKELTLGRIRNNVCLCNIAK